MAFIDTKDRYPLKLLDLMNLKDCPFCGGKARIEHNQYELPDFAYCVRCMNCHAKAEASGTGIKAARNWNRRAKHE